MSSTSADSNENDVPPLARVQHISYIMSLDDASHTFEYWITEHLRVSGVYWGLSAMALLGSLDRMPAEKAIAFVLSCQHTNGAFGGNTNHDPHLLYTLSAVQVLCMYDALDRIDAEKVVNWVSARQNDDGSFTGDEWGEVDTRFSYCAVSCLKLLGRLDAINTDKAIEYVVRCRNFDGAFGCIPDAESHAGQSTSTTPLASAIVMADVSHDVAFCCVGMLAILNALEHVDAPLLSWWLAERQVPNGGLNGRPEKLPDVCYSWWVLSALRILHHVDWINKEKLTAFILRCQDTEKGGFADRPGDLVDIFHTFFGLAGLKFLGHEGLNDVDPAYALPVSTLRRMGIDLPWLDEEAAGNEGNE